MNEDFNKEYMRYSDGLVYKILLFIVPNKFLKAITYNAIFDTKMTILEDLDEVRLHLKGVNTSIEKSYDKLLESYDIKNI